MSGFGKTLPPEFKGAPLPDVLEYLLPDYTCPDVNLVEDFLLSSIAPPEVLEALERVRAANSNLRQVAKLAIRELRREDDGDQPLRDTPLRTAAK